VGVDGVGALAGVRVVVTRPAERAGGFVARLENAGATVIKLPTIATADPDSWAPVDAAIARLASGAYLWVMFTSRIGAERFLERVARHAAGDALDSALVGAVGPGTARCLEEAGVKVSLVPKLFTAAALASEIGPAPSPAGPENRSGPSPAGPENRSDPGPAGPENRSGPGSAGPQNKADHGSAGAQDKADPGSAGPQDKAEPGRVLLPRAAEKPPDMRAVLTGAGWSVDEVTVYRTVPAGEGPAAPAVRAGDFDVVTFTSGSAARAFVGLVGKPAELGLAPGGDDSALRSRPGGPAYKVVACIGPVTAAVVADLGFRVDVVAEEHTTEGLVAALAGMGT